MGALSESRGVAVLPLASAWKTLFNYKTAQACFHPEDSPHRGRHVRTEPTLSPPTQPGLFTVAPRSSSQSQPTAVSTFEATASLTGF